MKKKEFINHEKKYLRYLTYVRLNFLLRIKPAANNIN